MEQWFGFRLALPGLHFIIALFAPYLLFIFATLMTLPEL